MMGLFSKARQSTAEARDVGGRFERVVVPHIPAAYNLARYLVRNEQDAEDVAQEACLRAFRYLDSYRGIDGRAWLLRIVRNTCYTFLSRKPETVVSFDDIGEVVAIGDGPELSLLRKVDRERLRDAVEALPVPLREVIVLRELETLAYKEIAEIVDIPLGTVMSRLSRARKQLAHCLMEDGKGEGGGHGLS